MVILYNIGIAFYRCMVAVVSPFNSKAKFWRRGQKGCLARIKNTVEANCQIIWVHCSSLGEFEQGRPILEAIRQRNTGAKILLTFFSPSGYEVRKKYSGADYVFYLPVDTRKNATEFINIIKPQVAIFVKYEFWYHYLNQLNKQQIPTYLVSAIFRPEQVFFKSYGLWYRKFLLKFTHLFVQNEASKKLLGTIGIANVTVAGDTRFDRVLSIAKQAQQLPIVEHFCGTNPVIVAGSTWPKDEELLATFMMNVAHGCKLIIAPHEVHEAHIQGVLAKFDFKGVVRYTQAKHDELSNAQVLIVDTIGILSSVYRYGQIAYIGGGFGAGIHNTLEAAAHGLPTVFGPNYQRFQEACDLISCRGAFAITNAEELEKVLNELLGSSEELKKSSGAAQSYVETGAGATQVLVGTIF